MRLYYYEFI